MAKVLIKELGKVITGNTPNKANEDYYNSADIGFVKPDIISDSEITSIEDTKEYISEEARSKARIVKKNTVFVTCIGSIGKIGIVRGDELAFNQQINAIEPNEKVLPKYLAYCLLYNKKKLADIANAPVVPIINKTLFENFTVNITEDKKEQRKTLDILNKVSSIIDYRKRQLKEVDNLIKSRFVEMFGCEEFSKVTLKEICKKITDGTHKTPNYQSEGITFISAKNIIKGKLDFSDVKYILESEYEEIQRRCLTEKGDVLLSKSGSLGAPVIVETDERLGLFESLAVIKADWNLINNRFLCEQLKSDEIQRQFYSGTKGVAIKHLHLNVIGNVNIILPPIELQNEFAAFVHQVDKLKFEVQKY